MTTNILTPNLMQEVSLEADIGIHCSIFTKSPIDPNINFDHSHLLMQLLCLKPFFECINFCDLLQTTQDDDVVGGNVATVSFGYNLPHLLQTLGSRMLPKVKANTHHEILLFQYILEHPNEHGYIKLNYNIINWEAFARDWEYYCRV